MEKINLEKVGIPFKDDQTICKLLLVSRDANLLCKDMGAQKCFPIQPLQREEAWHLLKNIAGDSVECSSRSGSCKREVYCYDHFPSLSAPCLGQMVLMASTHCCPKAQIHDFYMEPSTLRALSFHLLVELPHQILTAFGKWVQSSCCYDTCWL